MIFTIFILVAIAGIVIAIATSRESTPKEDVKPTPTPKPMAVKPKVSIVQEVEVPVQKLRYFCIKDKGYHVSVWPNGYDQFDIVEFSIAGMSHRDGIDDHLGEFEGTLVPEPANPYDSNAIKILAADGHHVGYVPKDTTDEIRQNSTLPCTCYCYIGCNGSTYFSDCYILRKSS